MTEQGKIVGSVTMRKGNFMPRIMVRGIAETDQKNENESGFLKTGVHVFKGKIKEYKADAKNVYKIVQSQDDGKYSVDVEPGVYTMLIPLADGKLYFNGTDNDGNYRSVIVKAKETATFNICDDSQAFC